VSKTQKAFLKYAYRAIPAFEEKTTPFDLDHLLPVDRLKKLLGAGPGWPIGCVSNLALFPKGLNRGKRSKTLNEWLASRESDQRTKIESRLEPFLFTTLSATDIRQEQSEDGTAVDAMTEAEYVAFLKSRWGTLRTVVLDGLDLADDPVAPSGD